jgi:hypothetical protein
MTMTPEQQYEILVDGIQLLAASAADQVSALPDYVCVTDEVVSNFGDAYLLVPQLQRAGLVSELAATALKDLDDHLAAMPADDALMEASSLDTHDFWAEARKRAASALQALGVPQKAPSMKHVSYVEGG